MKNLTILLMVLFLAACGENGETIYVTPEIPPTLQTLTIHIEGSGCSKSTVVTINGEDTRPINGGTNRDIQLYPGTYTLYGESNFACVGGVFSTTYQTIEVTIKEGSNHVYFD